VEFQPQNGGVTDFAWLDELMTDTTSTKAGTPLDRAVTFDGLAQPTSWNFTHQATGPSALRVDVRRDNMGRIASSSEAFGAPSGVKTSWRGYVYDAMGRLSVVRESVVAPTTLPAPHQATQVMGVALEAAANTVPTAARWAYARETAIGSVLSINRTNLTPTAPRFSTGARGAGHQLQSYDVDGSGARTVTHDGAGRLTSDGTQRFVFDDMGALAETRETATDAVKEAYLYDASGRLVSRTGVSGDAEVLVYDGLHMVQAYDGAGVLSWAASWGPGIDRLLSLEKSGTEYFALDDGKGSVVGWLDANSNTVPARAEYTPEGRGKYFNEAANTSCTESGSTRCSNHLGLPFGFHSAFVAKQSGLLYFRNRWYSTEANQWLSQDPLDFVDSFNLYAFNAFDSVNHRDPLGLNREPAGAATVGEPPKKEDLMDFLWVTGAAARA
jgi:RHS repeat-associated protein